MPFNLSTGEILVLLLVALLLFGGRLPQVAGRMGRSIHEFRRGMREEMRKIEREVQTPESTEPKRDDAGA